jgi:hypothetical protein
VEVVGQNKKKISCRLTNDNFINKWKMGKFSSCSLFITNGFAGKKNKKNKRKRVLVRREISRKKT